MSINDYDFLDNESNNLCVVYIKHIGVDIDNLNIYHFFLSSNADMVFGEGWSEVPACNTPRSLLDIENEMYEFIAEIKTDIKLDLAQDCCCFSMQDARDNIVALGYENLDGLDEYPEPRIVIHFGDKIDDVENILKEREIKLNFIR